MRSYVHGMIREAFALPGAPMLRVEWSEPLSGKLSVRLGQDCTASSTCSGGERHEPEPMDSAGAGEERVRVTAVAYEHGPSLP